MKLENHYIMRPQDAEFIKTCEKVRETLRMSLIGIKKSTQFKLRGSIWNGVKYPDLSDWEVEMLDKGLEKEQNKIQDLRYLLKQTKK